MATNLITTQYGNLVQVCTWSGLTTDEKGQPYMSGNLADKCVQIFGDFGGAASVTMQGSNDPRVVTDPANAVWFTLTDPSSAAITKTSAAGEQILENPVWIRPAVTLGTNPSITVIVCAKGVY